MYVYVFALPPHFTSFPIYLSIALPPHLTSFLTYLPIPTYQRDGWIYDHTLFGTHTYHRYEDGLMYVLVDTPVDQAS